MGIPAGIAELFADGLEKVLRLETDPREREHLSELLALYRRNDGSTALHYARGRSLAYHEWMVSEAQRERAKRLAPATKLLHAEYRALVERLGDERKARAALYRNHPEQDPGAIRKKLQRAAARASTSALEKNFEP